jgi:hypothetical protein
MFKSVSNTLFSFFWIVFTDFFHFFRDSFNYFIESFFTLFWSDFPLLTDCDCRSDESLDRLCKSWSHWNRLCVCCESRCKDNGCEFHITFAECIPHYNIYTLPFHSWVSWVPVRIVFVLLACRLQESLVFYYGILGFQRLCGYWRVDARGALLYFFHRLYHVALVSYEEYDGVPSVVHSDIS